MAWTKTVAPGIVNLISDGANDYNLALEDANFANGMQLTAWKIVPSSNTANFTSGDRVIMRHAANNGPIVGVLRVVTGDVLKEHFSLGDDGYYIKPYFANADQVLTTAANYCIVLEYRKAKA